MVPLDTLQDLIPPVGAADDVETVVEDETTHLRSRHQHARIVAPVPSDLIQEEKNNLNCFEFKPIYYYQVEPDNT